STVPTAPSGPGPRSPSCLKRTRTRRVSCSSTRTFPARSDATTPRAAGPASSTDSNASARLRADPPVRRRSARERDRRHAGRSVDANEAAGIALEVRRSLLSVEMFVVVRAQDRVAGEECTGELGAAPQLRVPPAVRHAEMTFEHRLLDRNLR